MSSPKLGPLFAEKIKITPMVVGVWPNRYTLEITIRVVDLQARNWDKGDQLRELVLSSRNRSTIRLEDVRIDKIYYGNLMRVDDEGKQFVEPMAFVELVGTFDLRLSMWRPCG